MCKTVAKDVRNIEASCSIRPAGPEDLMFLGLTHTLEFP